MKKHNPLFLDSTQPVGDKFITNVELLGVQLGQGESLYLEVTDSFGLMQKFAMKQLATKKSVRYSAELWLNQGENIQYRFILVSGGTELKSSVLKKADAGHAISDVWTPMTDEQLAEFKSLSKNTKLQKVTSDLEESFEGKSAVKKKKDPTIKKTKEIKNISFSKTQESLNASEIQQLKFLLEELE